MSSFLQVLIDGILSGLLYALVAAGLSMIWGVMDVINFAHGEFLMVAMYVCYWLGFILGLDPLFTWIASGIFLFIMGALTYKLVIKHSLGKAADGSASCHVRPFNAFEELLHEPFLPELPPSLRHRAGRQDV